MALRLIQEHEMDVTSSSFIRWLSKNGDATFIQSAANAPELLNGITTSSMANSLWRKGGNPP
jgi:hypothetical protein